MSLVVHTLKQTWSSTCLMFWPTYSMTISSAAMGSMANRPHSWILLRPKRSFFLRNCIKTDNTHCNKGLGKKIWGACRPYRNIFLWLLNNSPAWSREYESRKCWFKFFLFRRLWFCKLIVTLINNLLVIKTVFSFCMFNRVWLCLSLAQHLLWANNKCMVAARGDSLCWLNTIVYSI